MIKRVFAIGIAVAASCLSVVRAEHAKPDKTFACSSGTACLEGLAGGSAVDGVYGNSSGNGTHGVYGTSNWAGAALYASSTSGGSGVSGVSTSTSGSANGVYGRSTNGPGVYGTTNVAGLDAVEGVTTQKGSVGVYGYSKGDGYGVTGETDDTSGNYAAIVAQGDDTSNALFLAYNSATSGQCLINKQAALSCTGGITGSALRVRRRNSGGQRVLTYASESASATIQDSGTARMFDGVANVSIDPAFASVTDHRWYYVFLTPLGETRGLYVSVKAASGFQVRETERGRDTLAFDYRIVAHPIDATNDRLPLAPAMQRPPKHRHPSQ
jgi:hypothetical protein